MDKSLASAVEAEKEAVASYDDLMAAKSKEVGALTKAIETKSVRVGELGVEIVTMKNDLTDNEQALIEDTKFLQDLDKNCALKTKEWDERTKTGAEELVALAETIKVLNDDDALEMFKKTLPSPSLLQVISRSDTIRRKAREILKAAGRTHKKDVGVDFIELALTGKKVDFSKVIKMIDDMVVLLGKEQ